MLRRSDFCRRLLLWALVLLTVHAVAAGRSHGLVDVKNYSSAAGLSLKMIQNMVQDEDGYIWIATWNGLEKFDGYTFRNYKSYPTDEERLQHNRIQNVFLAFRNALWCETYDHKLYIFDTAAEKFINPFASHPDVRACDGFEKIFFTDNGVVWLAAPDGAMWRIDGERYMQEGGILHFPADGRQTEIYGVFSDAGGGEWILGNAGYRVHGKEGISGMRRFLYAVRSGEDLMLVDDKGALAVYNTADGLKDVSLGVRLSDSRAATVLRDGRVAFPSLTGVLLYDPATGSSRHIGVEMSGAVELIYEPSRQAADSCLWMLAGPDVFRICLNGGKAERLSYPGLTETQFVFFVHEDESGELWVHPTHGPLCHYNHETGTLERAYCYSSGRRVPTPDIVLNFMIDNHRNLWARDEVGFNKITFTSGAADYLTFSQEETRCVFIDSKNRIWSADKGFKIRIHDSEGRYLGNFTRSGTIVMDENASFGASVYSMMEDSRGRIWIGSRADGLFLAVPGKGAGYSVSHFAADGSKPGALNCEAVYSTYEDSRGRIWIGTYGGGLNLVEEKDGKFSFLNIYNRSFAGNTGWKCRRVRHISETSGGVMMVGTTDGLLTFSSDFRSTSDIVFHHNWCDLSRKSTLSNNDVFFTFEDSRGAIYVTTHGGGICRLTSPDLLSDSLEFSYTGKQEGLPTDMVYSLAEDGEGRLWLSLENAICRYDPANGMIETYDRCNLHLPVVLSEAPFVIDRRGRAYFAMLNGTMTVDLPRLRKSSYSPNIVFDRATVSPSNELSKSFPLSEGRLWLEAAERNFAVSFVALDFDNTQNISYAYRLQGINDNWIDIGHNHEAAFYSLPAGDYVLEVRSTNGDGVWADNVRSLPIHVEPTFMETIWARILYAGLFIAFGLAVWLVVAYILRLHRQVSMEQELTRMKLRFFTDVSHELRTPLTLIVNPIEEVMADPSLSKDSKEYMSIAKSNTDRMLRLINQLLDVRKIQNNKMKIYVERVDVVPLLRRIYNDFSILARQKGIDFRLTVPMQAHWMYTDVDKLEKIIFNLLSNAFKYTPDGRAVTLEAGVTGENLTVAVIDEGPGMDRKQAVAVFDRFETLGRKKGLFSSGIGLALVRELVRVLHGNIEVDSKPGEGSRFEVSLPGDFATLHSDPDAEFILTDRGAEPDATPGIVSADAVTVAQEAAVATIPESSGEGEGLTVMIVEDNGELRKVIAKMLCGQYRVVQAADGEEAWEKIGAEMPDIIISDIMMPRLDGLELLERIRRTVSCCHIPVVLLSAKASVYDRIAGLECGADDYLTKPFSAGYLRSRIKSLLEQRTRLRKYFIDSVSAQDDMRPTDKAELADTPALTAFDEKFISELRGRIAAEMKNPDFTIEEMASAMNLGRTVFNRKVRSLFNMAPVELLKTMRVRHACTLLEKGECTVAEVAYMSGFSSPQYFNRVFKSVTGLTPKEWQSQRVAEGVENQ